MGGENVSLTVGISATFHNWCVIVGVEQSVGTSKPRRVCTRLRTSIVAKMICRRRAERDANIVDEGYCRPSHNIRSA